MGRSSSWKILIGALLVLEKLSDAWKTWKSVSIWTLYLVLLSSGVLLYKRPFTVSSSASSSFISSNFVNRFIFLKNHTVLYKTCKSFLSVHLVFVLLIYLFYFIFAVPLMQKERDSTGQNTGKWRYTGQANSVFFEIVWICYVFREPRDF